MPGQTSGIMQLECRSHTALKLPFSAMDAGSELCSYASFCIVFPYDSELVLGRERSSLSMFLDMDTLFCERGIGIDTVRSAVSHA
jgi:hypothetical protein